MGNNACCQDNNHPGKLQLGQLTVLQPVSTTIQNFLHTHPRIAEILQQNRQLEQKFVDAKKSGMRDFQEFVIKDGVFVGKEVEEGKRKGYGIMLYSEGHYYEGQWSDDMKNGNGILVNDDGSCYYGEWKNDLAEGHGVHESKNPPTSYNGQWKAGLKNGKGIERHEDGSIYNGSFVNGIKNGTGKLTYSNGTEYQGQFLNNIIQGTGTFRGKTHIYQGQWKAGKMHGTGRSQWRNGKGQVIAKYIGEYKGGIKEGFGEYTDSKGVTYKAIWTDGEINDKGPVVTENTRESFSDKQRESYNF